ncbi:hypothetical protein NF867_13370 [Solitalea sp. MAHUQ-68]|uniref:Uncharacterized protein n=1 Tax=Solitalea agri TaxID=2953739 RepID=A0A9X2F470_9SPHI|nr:hypothetical protein [Solitalea agri]MCO4293855.1 hypothetical protein [Solitalea agri]
MMKLKEVNPFISTTEKRIEFIAEAVYGSMMLEDQTVPMEIVRAQAEKAVKRQAIGVIKVPSNDIKILNSKQRIPNKREKVAQAILKIQVGQPPSNRNTGGRSASKRVRNQKIKGL